MPLAPARPTGAVAPPAPPAFGDLAAHYAAVRGQTERLVEPLSPEDCVVQAMDDASPAKWHLAHTSWFFEAFLLKPYLTKYRAFDDRFGFLFNSYYNAHGARHARHARGVLTRPSLGEIIDYRAHVDRHMAELLDGNAKSSPETARLIEVGLHHEQQHQELLLTDIKYTLWCNPLRPAYRDGGKEECRTPSDGPGSAGDVSSFTPLPAGLYEIGHAGPAFGFDNERPRHRAYLHDFELADEPATCGRWRAFIEDGGYRRANLWLAAGWAAAQREGWEAPLYWEGDGDDRTVFTLAGVRPLDDAAPVCHVSYYEADAFARWADARLPTEFEWEAAAEAHQRPGHDRAGDFSDAGVFHPRPVPRAAGPGPRGLAGGVWEWTASPYVAYPGYAPPPGALGEYNGKFMSDQWVLRGGSCATPASHARRTYRNFFPADKRWQFGGVRLAR